MMRLCIFFVGLLICWISIVSVNTFAFADQAKVTISVVGEDGLPVEGANAGVSFERNTVKGTQVVTKRGTTDAEGEFTASEDGNGFISCGVHKQSYYDSYYHVNFSKQNFGRWEPWNPVIQILLRKIENPVPMYVRNTLESRLELPVANKNIGFDLVKFDWVIPYGQGKSSDFVFHLKRPSFISRDNYDATLTITFNNKYDGIQPHMEKHKDGSQYKLPRYAPETGYQDKLVLQESFGAKGPVTQNFKFRADDLNYIFRVRSSEKDGKIERAMYGKILGYIDFSAMESKTAKIFMKYYLNPDYTRNLEFDPKRNLFGNLPDLERVNQP